MNLSFVDIETTGSRMTYDRVIEIGILRVEEGSLVKTYNKLINPEVYLSPFIEQMTGISSLDLEKAPTFDELKEEIMEMLDETVFVAHNVRFDYGFLKNELKRYGLDLSLKQLCTVKLSRALFPQHRRHNLDALIERFHFSCEHRHRALDDAKVLWDFYSLLPKQFKPQEVDEVIQMLMKSPSIPTHLNATEIQSLPEKPGVYIFYGADGLPLYIGKSTNIKDRVLSHFTNDYTSTKEMNLVQQLNHIETITTAGELGALLKESDLIKKMQPVYNRQLRLSRKLTVLKKTIDNKGFFTVVIEDVDYLTASDTEVIIGIFKSQKQAKEYMSSKAIEYNLCEKILGIEKGSGPCFGSKIERCRGACSGREIPVAYNIRFVEAFNSKKIKSWPFKGAIKIIEYDSDSEKKDEFILDKWCLLSDEYHDQLLFDYDIYKILRRYLYNPANRKHIVEIDKTAQVADSIYNTPIEIRL